LKPGERINQLREQGYEVKVFHHRPAYNVAGLKLVGYRARKELADGERFLQKGGTTTVRIDQPEGDYVVGEALCSAGDQYCYRRGLEIALGRALVQLTGEAARRAERRKETA